MKSKIIRILGVGLTVAVLASLLVVGAPASALTLSWGAEAMPTTTGNIIAPASLDIVDMAVAGNGTTIYAATTLGFDTIKWEVTTTNVGAAVAASITVTYTDQNGNTGNAATAFAVSANATAGTTGTITLATGDFGVKDVTGIALTGWTGSSAGVVAIKGVGSAATLGSVAFDGTFTDGSAGAYSPGLYKSLDAGATWTKLTNPTGVGTSISKVALAADVTDGSMVAIIADGKEVYVSTNGGTTWSDLNPVADTSGAATSAADVLYSLDLSKPVGTIRDLAVGGSTSANATGVWYFEISTGFSVGKWIDAAITDATDGWDATMFVATEAAFAVKFSPNFPADRTLAVLTGPDGAGSTVNRLQLANFANKRWNSAGNYAGWNDAAFPALQTIAANSAIVAAELALPSTFLGPDATSRVIFASVATNDGTNKGGLYRFTDAAKASLVSTTNIAGVAFHDAGKLVAGAYDSNNVYRLASALTATSASILSADFYKRPGEFGVVGDTARVVARWAGANAVTGTSGLESSFSVSKNDGKSFNDISLIDNNVGTVPTVLDFAVSADGAKVYMTTRDGSGAFMSLWRKVTAWEKVFSLKDADNFIVRAAPENFDVVYLAELTSGTSTNQFYYGSDAGETTWLPRVATQAIADVAIESASVAYVLTPTGGVSKSVDAGFIWDNPLTSLGFAGATIVSLSKDNLIAGGTAGQVAFSTNGGTSFTSLAAAPIASGNVQVTASGLAAGGFIYAASSNAATNVYRWTIGTSVAWTSMRGTTINNATGIALSGGVLYVITTSGADSTLYRTLYPSVAAASDAFWSAQTTTGKTFTDGPRALFAGPAGKLWGLDTDTSQAINSWTETLAAAGPTLVSPAANATIDINTASGEAQDVAFTWAQLSTATSYEIQVALDSAFTTVLVNPAVAASGLANIVKLLGPDSGGPEFESDVTYYWRVRVSVNSPVDSPWSAVRSFRIAPLVTFAIVSPAKGAYDVPVKPNFVWTAFKGATTYELVVSEDPTFAIIDFSRTSNQTYFSTDEPLAYSTTYYWRVRPAGGDWVYGVFTTAARPVTVTPTPPITITTQPPATVTVNVPPPVEAVPSFLLYIIIAIGAVLVIALIVLIVRTRARGV